ncbi:ABC-type nitrate/sulfonate/bicarbonate transport system substrate-binding protein [Paenibacillus phyllosphaerae]|uniref:ABC-type nitrate/sulfonate/bicarbonate transport system substrate-binding protein n=1 Tax=Paenibacillus phyllosphaerae TaxID=274593 RepID=A0A7W5B0B8_9BACL|nr:ABC transporter substrate-binding protein [Paenibacillus phyllosphaerae]MBB3111571.1 ABC-type nitrate/sulfonate/bicarbonate transport system substrate-binding protein [Paenibacillus phyllosphaerae]
MERQRQRNRSRSRLGFILAAALVTAVALTGCGSNQPAQAQKVNSGKADDSTAAGDNAPGDTEPEILELRYQGGVGSVTLPELAEDLGYLAPIKLKWIGNTISGPQDIQSAATGDVDFGGAFNGAVVKLIASKAPVTPVVGYYGVDEKRWGGFFVLEDSPIKTAKDFIGKTVGMNTLGAHSEIVLKTWLKKEGLTDDEIDSVQLVVIPPINAEQALRQGQIDIATMGDMARDKALERGGIRLIFNDFDLLGQFTAGTYLMRNDFIEKNPNTTRKFVEAVARAIEWARETPTEEVIARLESIVEKRGRDEDPSPLKYFSSYGVAEKGGYISESEFTIWIEWLENAGTIKKGQIKAPDFYTNEFNPYKDDQQ